MSGSWFLTDEEFEAEVRSLEDGRARPLPQPEAFRCTDPEGDWIEYIAEQAEKLGLDK